MLLATMRRPGYRPGRNAEAHRYADKPVAELPRSSAHSPERRPTTRRQKVRNLWTTLLSSPKGATMTATVPITTHSSRFYLEENNEMAVPGQYRRE
jgi:hypothetical protein